MFLPQSFCISSFLSQSLCFPQSLCGEAPDQHHLGIAMPETLFVPWMQCHLERADTGEGHFGGQGMN